MPQAQFVQQGNEVDHTPGADIAAGSLVIIGDLVGIASRDIKANTVGALTVEGIFDVPKDPSQAISFSAGQKVYVDADGEPQTSATGNTLLGKSVKAAAAAGTFVRVRLDP